MTVCPHSLVELAYGFCCFSAVPWPHCNTCGIISCRAGCMLQLPCHRGCLGLTAASLCGALSVFRRCCSCCLGMWATSWLSDTRYNDTDTGPVPNCTSSVASALPTTRWHPDSACNPNSRALPGSAARVYSKGQALPTPHQAFLNLPVTHTLKRMLPVRC